MAMEEKIFGVPKFRPEHPRSSTTDDVECFFSVLRDMVGKDFTLKQVFFFLLLVDLNDNCVQCRCIVVGEKFPFSS